MPHDARAFVAWAHGPGVEAGFDGIAARHESLVGRVRAGGLDGLQGEEAARAREEAEKVMRIKRGRLCPDARIDALRAVGHGDYACNSYCYTFGAILARRIVAAAGGEGRLSREAIASICRALKQGLADARGPFDLAGCFGIALVPPTA